MEVPNTTDLVMLREILVAVVAHARPQPVPDETHGRREQRQAGRQVMHIVRAHAVRRSCRTDNHRATKESAVESSHLHLDDGWTQWTVTITPTGSHGQLTVSHNKVNGQPK